MTEKPVAGRVSTVRPAPLRPVRSPSRSVASFGLPRGQARSSPRAARRRLERRSGPPINIAAGAPDLSKPLAGREPPEATRDSASSSGRAWPSSPMSWRGREMPGGAMPASPPPHHDQRCRFDAWLAPPSPRGRRPRCGACPHHHHVARDAARAAARRARLMPRVFAGLGDRIPVVEAAPGGRWSPCGGARSSPIKVDSVRSALCPRAGKKGPISGHSVPARSLAQP